jgi:integrase
MSTGDKVEAMPDLHKAKLTQPLHVLGISANERNAFIVSMRKVGRAWTIVSRYGDDFWWLPGGPNNTAKTDNQLQFLAIPEVFRDDVKAMMYRLMRRGRDGKKRPGVGRLVKTLSLLKPFLMYVLGLGVNSLSSISPLICSTYVQHCKALKTGRGKNRILALGSEHHLSDASLCDRFTAVEALFELSQYTDVPMPQHPWPDTSANYLSGYGKSRGISGKKTPLIPDKVFSTLFQNALAIVQKADWLLDLRQEMDKVYVAAEELSNATVNVRRNCVLENLGWKQGYAKLVSNLLDIRTACYIVIASVSGCRNHELTFLRINAYYSNEDDKGVRYWWMRSRSTKTDEGNTEWMIPEAAITALKVMERWSAPYQAILYKEIEDYRSADPTDIRIAEANEHLDALFVGADKAKGNQVRTLGVRQFNDQLRAFASACGLTWSLSTHQFRRKFANYAARSQFGDLRYLKEHFKHWSLDMTLGYAMNESQEMALYLDIQDELDEIKGELVAQWFNSSEPLAGGYGNNIVNWRSREENIVLFKSHAQMVRSIAQSTAIRSNGHAWCTADDNQCVGNDLEPTRCANGCTNAVIGRQHAQIYQGLYDQLKHLENCEDIGEGGRTRVRRDLDRCRTVFTHLGHDPVGAIP